MGNLMGYVALLTVFGILGSFFSLMIWAFRCDAKASAYRKASIKAGTGMWVINDEGAVVFKELIDRGDEE